MNVTIIRLPFGFLAFDKNQNIISKKIFQKDINHTAEDNFLIESGVIPEEIISWIKDLKEKNYDTFIFEEESLLKNIKYRIGKKIKVIIDPEIGKFVRENIADIAVKSGFINCKKDLDEWIHNISIALSKLKVKEKTSKKDFLIINAINSIDDLDKTINLFTNRIKEWYGIHFPELSSILEKNETYVKLIHNLGNRFNFNLKNLSKYSLSEEVINKILRTTEDSMGSIFSDYDIQKIQKLSSEVLNLIKINEILNEYVEQLMEELAPNCTSIVGPFLGARLIALANGLDNLAKMPTSKIQVLGAEKALFRSITTGAKPPKHGIIFQHPYIHNAKRWQRGKIARAFAGKLAIAIRADVFGEIFIADRLNDEIEKRVDEIKKKYKKPKSSKRIKSEKKKYSQIRKKRNKRRT